MIYCYHSINILGGIGMTLTRRAISEGTAEQARTALMGIKESQLAIKLQTIISPDFDSKRGFAQKTSIKSTKVFEVFQKCSEQNSV